MLSGFESAMKPPALAAQTQELIYLDFAAATPVSKTAREAMLPWLDRWYGNPANRLHPMGEAAEQALAWARATVAACVEAEPAHVTFTASATEALNLVLRGLAYAPRRARTRILYAATEHSAVIATAQRLAELIPGLEAVELPVDASGAVLLAEAAALIDERALCVCAMDLNNETGVAQPALGALVELAHRAGAPFLLDAAQGFARGAAAPAWKSADFLVLASAKLYGPKGAAALVSRPRKPRLRLEAQLTGGGQEAGLRSGTQNLPSIVGFAAALAEHHAERDARRAHMSMLEGQFLTALRGHLPFQRAGGSAAEGSGILMLLIPEVNAMKLIEECATLCVSVGSACKTLQATASHVLLAMGFQLEEALSSFRVSLGLPTTASELARAAFLLRDAATRARSR